jgi:hypothetical protein
MGFKVVFSIPQIPSFLLCATQDAIETLTQEHSSGPLLTLGMKERQWSQALIHGLVSQPGNNLRYHAFT